jgi:hypothetical protein
MCARSGVLLHRTVQGGMGAGKAGGAGAGRAGGLEAAWA